MASTETLPTGLPELVDASAPDPVTGYRAFTLGGFTFSRDAYFTTITWPIPSGARQSHTMAVDYFLRALMRDVAWGFFYGWVNFDHVFGTKNQYGTVQVYGGRYNEALHTAGVSYVETFESPVVMATFKAMLSDWTNAGWDPFAAPEETGKTVFGPKNGDNDAAINRDRVVSRRMVSLPGDSVLRDDTTHPVNRHFIDVPQDEPEVVCEPGFEGQLGAYNLFAYLSRSDVTWNPSVVSVCKQSLACPTTEEFILPVKHGNDRIEWFIQLSDHIVWDVEDKETGRPRARVTMRAGDVAAMPADIRHQGYSPKRSMLFVWENATPGLPERYEHGELNPYPAEF